MPHPGGAARVPGRWAPTAGDCATCAVAAVRGWHNRGVPKLAVSRRRSWPAVVVACVAVVLLTAGCSGDSVDRDAAVAEVQQRWAGRLDDVQAGCYVDRVLAEVGAVALEDETVLAPSQVGRLTDIRVDCIGIDNLAAVGSTTTAALDPDDTWLANQPMARGDDPQLDLLWVACEDGDGAACDQLFDRAVPGSEYEEFALTCGGRTRELVCADVYRSSTPTSTTPSP